MTDVQQAAQEARPGYRAVLANTEFRALWFAHVTSMLGDQLTRIVLASIVLARTGSVALSALSFATTYLPWLLGGPLLSLFADRCPRRTVMVTCDVGRGLLVLAMVVPGVPVWGLFALASLVALLGPPFEAARGATVPEVLPAPLYPVAQALSMASLQAAQLLGFALGGLLVTLKPGAWVLVLDAATFLVSAAVLHRYVAWRPGAEDAGALSARTWARDSAEGLRVVVRAPDLRMLLGLSAVVAAVTVLPESLAIAQADELGRTPFVAGLLCAALPLGTVVGAALAGRPGAGDDRLWMVRPLGLLACSASAACLLEPGLAGLVVLWFLAGIGAGGLLPANVAFVLRVDPAVRGRALSVAQVVLQVSQGLAVAAGGLLAAAVGPSAAVGWAGVLGLVGVGVMSARWRAALRSVAPDEAPPAAEGASSERHAPTASGPAFGRVRVFTVLVALAAAALWWAVGRHVTALAGPVDVPWCALLPAVTAAQVVNVHFQVRRQAHGISLCHLPIVIGLVCTDPFGFVVARTLGGSVAMAAFHRQRGLKLMLNTASYALEATVAVALLGVLSGWPIPAALYVAMAVADMTSFTVVGTAIMLFERRFDAVARLRTLLWLLPVNVVATSFSLLAVAALWQGSEYLVLLAGVTAALLTFYRTYARLVSRHLDLGLLQELAASLPALTSGSQDLCDVLERTRQLLVAERASLWLPDGSLTVARHDALPVASSADGSCAPSAARVHRLLRPPVWSRLRSDVSFDEGRQCASLVVQDRLGAVRPFTEDDKRLLDAAAALIGGALDRGADRQRMLDAARRDPLTGLWTLTEGSRRAAQDLRGAGARGLLVLDVIGLQDVNDSLGHDAGDELLRIAARRLQDHVGAVTVAARIGGDELMVLLHHGDPGPEELARAVSGTVDLAGARFQLRMRAGYCAVSDASSFQELLRNAQAALSRSSVGGTRYRSWTSELRVDPTRRLALAGDLQNALANGDVFPVFQPLCRAADHAVVGAEALARWRHQHLGPVPPDEFIAIAEQTGLIAELTSVVLDRSLMQARSWQDQGFALRVSVNLSSRSLTEGDLCEAVTAALQRHGLPPSALLLEITESTIMSNVEHASAVLGALRDAGVHTALDDFGTGHSSLTQLHAIPVDEIKLDRSFLARVDGDLAARRVVATAVALCHDLGKTVVAEGVEDLETADFLRDSGVDLLQGYYFGRPLPAEEWRDGTLPHARVAAAVSVPAQSTGEVTALTR